jgi:hypothetical protein
MALAPLGAHFEFVGFMQPIESYRKELTQDLILMLQLKHTLLELGLAERQCLDNQT